jgi:RNA recognition motif-containing protein
MEPLTMVVRAQSGVMHLSKGCVGKETGMSTNIYVGNLPFSATEDEIRTLFSTYGTVESVNLITDRDTGRLRGFGFVEMASGANEAIAALNQTELGGRLLTVNPAKPREERSPRSRRW